MLTAAHWLVIEVGHSMRIFSDKIKESVVEFEQISRSLRENSRRQEENGAVLDVAGGRHRGTEVLAVPVGPMSGAQTVSAIPMIPRDPDQPCSVVSKGSVWEGSLKVEGSVRVDGKLSGELEAADAVDVAEGAEVDAGVKAKFVIISGQFRGQVHSSERLEVMPTGRVAAELTTQVLVVHDGAIVEGQIHMARSDLPSPSTAPAPSDRLGKLYTRSRHSEAEARLLEGLPS